MGNFINTLGFPNPLVCDTIQGCLATIIDIVIFIAIPLIVLMIMYSGFQFIVAQGRPEKLALAKKTIVWVFWGAFVILASKTLAIALSETVQSL